MPRQVKYEIARALQRGCILMIRKTKPRDEGGRQLVSVGPYREAVRRGRKYALITKHDQREFTSANSAAEAFIGFVNRDRAWEALQHAKCPRARRPGFQVRR